MEKKPFYITTPIYYPSDKLHIGHSYCTVATDAMARYKRLQGYDVLFLTGTDEHGQKIEEKAKAAGVTPKQYVDNVVDGIKKLWKLMNISNDRFIRTTDDYHVEAVQKIFKQLYDQGDIYKGVYRGKYCTPCESFWTENQLVDGKCPDCGREVKDAEEEAYFFRLSNYADRILKFYDDNPDFLQPQSRLNEMKSFIQSGLEDLCVSRTSFSWGIPVTFDPKHVVYVWVDALTNYITALGYGNSRYHDYEKFWPADVHFVGKEIVRFHAIIWPAMLMALNLPLPKKVFGHGWLLLEGGKMSKSKGNVVDPVVLCDRYGVDAIRYFLLREFPFGTDGVFSNEALITRINADLANDLGNLVSRTTAMVEKYFGGTLPTLREDDPLDEGLRSLAAGLPARYEAAMESYAFQSALMEVMNLVKASNKYIDDTAPWVLGKDESKRARLATVLYNLIECIRIVSVFLQPFMPETSEKIRVQAGLGAAHCTWASAAQWGVTPADVTVKKGDSLFPRIDMKKELAELEAAKQKAATPAPKQEAPQGVAEITIEDFAKVSLRAAKILSCEKVQKSDKLLKLQLDDGSGTPRQVVSGIAAWYTPEELTGKTVVLVANLKPAKLRGEVSNGMILAADCDKDTVKVVFLDGVPAGGGHPVMEPIFDSHAHYDDEQFDPDRDALLNRIHKQGVSAIVNASSTMESCDTCVRLAQQYPFVYAAVGIHPNEAANLPEDWLDRLRALARRDRVVAIGEIGLDYYYKDPPAEVQKRVLRAQLALAKELDLPVIIHSRDAIMDTYEELKGRGLEGVIHCFSGSAEMAKLFLDEGFYLGFGGVVTFKNAKRVKAALAVTPLDRLLFETDCPYLAPEPFRGKRNDSSLIRYTAAAAEEILHTDRNVLLRTAADNAARLFRIG